MRVRVRTPKTIIRPTVGLMLSPEVSMLDILAKALDFEDRFRKPEMEVAKLLDTEVDIVLSNAKTDAMEGVTEWSLHGYDEE